MHQSSDIWDGFISYISINVYLRPKTYSAFGNPQTLIILYSPKTSYIHEEESQGFIVPAKN